MKLISETAVGLEKLCGNLAKRIDTKMSLISTRLQRCWRASDISISELGKLGRESTLESFPDTVASEISFTDVP